MTGKEQPQQGATGQALLHRRIVGVETEYGIASVGAHSNSSGTPGPSLGPDEIARYMFRPVVDRWSSSNVFLPNASRLYLDIGSHPEVATAECDSVSQLIAHEKAGDHIVNEMAVNAEQRLAAEGIPGQVFLFKNNLDTVGNSYGCHENYLVGRSVVLKRLGEALLPFLITRQLICGAGSIQDGKFQLSQRADHVWEGVSSATTRSRPIINTRDEPHADSHRFRRLHVIVGDSNMSETTTAIKIGSTMLVLEMIEAAETLPEPLPTLQFHNNAEAIRAISRDLLGSHPITCADGSTITAVALQRAYARAARAWLSVRPAGGTPAAELERIVDLWERTLDAVEAGRPELVDTHIDWAIKLSLLRRYQQRLGLDAEDFSHPKLAHVDLAYHDIRPNRGIFPLLQAKGRVSRWIDDAHIKEAATTAPHTTRAHLRGALLKAAEETKAAVSCDWLRFKVTRPEPKMLELSDPLCSEDPRVDELISYMRAHQGTRGA